jgi:hypothetical protein
MMRYELTTPDRETVFVVLDTDDPDGFADLVYEGRETQVYYVRENLRQCYGLGGHLIGRRTTPVDLDIALKSKPMAGYGAKLLLGREVLAKFVRHEAP